VYKEVAMGHILAHIIYWELSDLYIDRRDFSGYYYMMKDMLMEGEIKNLFGRLRSPRIDRLLGALNVSMADFIKTPLLDKIKTKDLQIAQLNDKLNSLQFELESLLGVRRSVKLLAGNIRRFLIKKAKKEKREPHVVK
jgi:hypothetical protein